MSTYLNFVYSAATAATADPLADGECLATRICSKLSQRGDPSQFPPQLLIFLASPAFLKNPRVNELVPGIQKPFLKHYKRTIPLIGSSVGAVFWERKTHEEGAVLICLASRLLEVKVGATAELSHDPEQAVRSLVAELELDIDKGVDPNPRANRKLVTFLPGHLPNCPPECLYRYLSEAMVYRLPLTGGVSYSEDRGHHPGYQFTEFGLYSGALVAARMEFQVPVASGLGRCLRGTGHHVGVKSFCQETQEIQFENDVTAEDLVRDRGFTVLGKRVDDRYMGTVVLSRQEGRPPVLRLRNIASDDHLEILTVEPDRVYESAERCVREPARRVRMENPAGSIVFQCASYHRFRKPLGIDESKMLMLMENALKGAPVVGGFFDGEIGVDYAGHSMLANWVGASLTFGDEMRDRAVWQRGFKAIADSSGRLNSAESLSEVIAVSLDMIRSAGYPGALISLCLPDGEDDWIVPQRASGQRIETVANSCHFKINGEHPLADIIRGAKPIYFSDSRRQLCRDQSTLQAELISQYVFPLIGVTNPSSGTASTCKSQVLGLLQIDLGDSSRKLQLHQTEKEVLDSLGATVASSVARILSWEESRIIHTLDDGRNTALSSTSVNGGRLALLEAAVRAFEGSSAYVRILDEDGHRLRMVVGLGPYYEVAQTVRPDIDATDQTPTGQAWVMGNPRVVNDPKNDRAHNRLCERYRTGPDSNPVMSAALAKVASYSLAVVKNGAKRKLGTITILSDKIWSFHRYHLRCLEALADRLRFVSDHVEKRTAADFLLRIGADLAGSARVFDLGRALKTLVTNFKEASNSDVASLFLWDETFGKFVLHAQAGWAQRHWEFAAYYAGHEGWTGSVALEDEARYEADIMEYRRGAGIGSHGCYNAAMFGTSLIEVPETKMEGIGLPLLAGAKRIGVLTALKLYKPAAQGMSFNTTDRAVLAQATSFVSGYISSLLLYRSFRLADEARLRRETVHKAMLNAPEAQREAVLCQAICTEYKAMKVAFYPPGIEELKCVAAYPFDVLDDPDDVVHRVRREGGRAVIKVEVDESHRGDPDKSALLGAITRVCIAVPVEGEPAGILDLHWVSGVRRSFHILRNGVEELDILANRVGSMYQRHVLNYARRRAETKALQLEAKHSHRVEAMGTIAVQVMHKCGSFNVHLEALENMIKKNNNNSNNTEGLLGMIAGIRTKSDQLDYAIGLIKSGVELSLARERVKSMLSDVVSTFDWNGAIRLSVDVDPRIMVHANRDWTVEAFRNIVDNAVWAMRDRNEPSVLTISAVEREDVVEIIFKDTGVGMSLQEVEAAKQGRKSESPQRSGLGIPLVIKFLSEQGGSFDIKSRKGFGTEVIVKLPPVKDVN